MRERDAGERLDVDIWRAVLSDILHETTRPHAACGDTLLAW
jgi:hypothetical protein